MSAYDKVEEKWRLLRARKCIQSGHASGTHYELVYALMAAGVDCRGMSNDEIEGLAISYLARGDKK